MKKTSFIGSIISNTNKIISESNASWNGIRAGSLVKFKAASDFYNIEQIEKFLYIKDFTTIDQKTIKINDNTSIFLGLGDTLTISFKEYEIRTVSSIINGGQKYNVGDVLFLSGGIESINIETGLARKGIIKVIETAPGGMIAGISIEERGAYIEDPPIENYLKGGGGSGALLKLDFKLADSRTIIERDIDTIKIGDQTVISLSYPLPVGVKDGKLSCNKSSIILTNSFRGKTLTREPFEISQDFTPNYNWPLSIKNSVDLNSLYNQTLKLQDIKIKQLEDRICKLEQSV